MAVRVHRGVAGLLLGCLVLAGCSSDPAAPEQPTTAHPDVEPREPRRWAAPPPATAPPTAKPATSQPTTGPEQVVARAAAQPALVRFDSCDALLARLRGEALRQVGPYGLDGGAVHGAPAVASAGSAPAAASGADTAPAASGATFSGTNNQEAGVDEADVVKTDGRLLVTVRQRPSGVQVVDVSGTEPALRGFLPMPGQLHGLQLLLVQGRAVVLATAPPRESDGWAPRTAVKVLSLDDPDRPRVEREFVVEGSLSGARSVGDRILMVVQSSPQMTWAQPKDGSREAMAAATAENRRRVRAATVDSWLPSVTSVRTGRSHRASCASTMTTRSDSGVSMTSLVSLDPASDRPGEQVSVAGSGTVVYASVRSVYVATSPWQAASETQDPDEVTSDVHGFDIRDVQRPRYTGSGSVPGTLIGQYAMSEHAGHLRVASTVGRTWAPQGETPPSDNLVTVLRPRGERLEQVGQLRGLGPGERIYAVRFLGDLGYVVTFRETDPLYALDLSDPTRPTRRGELHVTGYSAYLHPLGDDLLLGVGQEVEANRRRGTQVSVFDVADMGAPSLRSRQVFPNGWSAVEHDPHALLWWPSTRLAVLPLAQHTEDGPSFTGAVALRVAADGVLAEVARLEHPRPAQAEGEGAWCCHPGILRSVVVRDALLTLSEDGVMTSELDSLKERAWSPYR